MKLRMQITKDRDIRFISHLEYVRTIERAIRRAKLPAAYSEGFNPHLKFSLASALGVGVVSYTEFVEIELAEPMEVELAAKALDKALPRGIRVLAADETGTLLMKEIKKKIKRSHPPPPKFLPFPGGEGRSAEGGGGED